MKTDQAFTGWFAFLHMIVQLVATLVLLACGLPGCYDDIEVEIEEKTFALILTVHQVRVVNM